jgi:hypothetical protein
VSRRLVCGYACVTVLALTAEFAASASGDVTAIEGQSFTGQVVDVGCAQSSGTIDWGDGTTSAGVSDGGTGVDGTHTYAAAGSYNASVSYTCPQFGASSHTASFQATVQDAPLTSSGIAIAGTAGSVASAAGGGFDVTGTHAYLAAGGYALHTTITDIGGSVTSADSTAQIAAPAPSPPLPGPPAPAPAPAPPPPAPTLGPPVAQFTYAPKRPCVGDQIAFDASTSTGQGRRIIRYRWSRPAPALFPYRLPPAVLKTPRGYSDDISGDNGLEIVGQRAADYVVVDYNPIDGEPEPHDYPAWHIKFIYRPVTVTLQVLTSNGETASITHRITFRDPVENIVIAYEQGILGGPPGGPGVTEPIGLVREGAVQACDSRTLLQKVELSTLKLRPAVLLGRPSGALHLSGASATVTVGIPCRYAQLGCDGTVELLSVKSNARHKASRTPGARELGRAQFLAAAGRRSARVAITLNAYGSALARAHKLGRVTLRLLSAGSNGRLSTSTRAIIIVGGRPAGA